MNFNFNLVFSEPIIPNAKVIMLNIIPTFPNHSKLWRATIVFWIEVAWLTVLTIWGLAVFCITVSHLRQFEEFMEKESVLHHWALAGIFVVAAVCYLMGFVLTFVLYIGTQSKDFKKLAFWAVMQSALWFFLLLLVIFEIIDSTGPTVYSITILFLAYRTLTIKVVYDAIAELRGTKITVPFFNMRNSEDRVELSI